MSRILLDTSAYSAFMRGHPAIRDRIRNSEEICLSPIVLGELKAGFRKGRFKKKNQEELEEFLASPRVSVVPMGGETADRYATILESLRKAGTPIPTNDLWIASSAMQHGLKVVTTDTHFKKVGQVIVEFFEAG